MSRGSPSAYLVAAAREGHADALAELYERYGRTLYGVAYRLMGRRDDAEDVLHDVFLGLPEALADYREQGHLEPWLRTLTARTSLMALRTTRRRRELSLETLPRRTVREAPPSTIDRVALERALGALAEPLREVFTLKVVDGYTHEEIGALLGITAAASRVTLHRARQELERRLRS